MTTAPEPALLQIGRRPAADQGQDDGQGQDNGWVKLPDIGPPSSHPVIAAAGGLTVLVCAVRGTLYAYRDGCAGCDSSLADGRAGPGGADLPGLRHPLQRPAGRAGPR